MSYTEITRRRFIVGLTGVVTCSLGRQAMGEELQPLSAEDPMAMALGYAAEAESVDASKNPTYKVGNNCANCMQFKNANADGFGACALFPGKKVASKAWCKAWVQG